MKRIIALFAACVVSVPVMLFADEAADKAKLESFSQKLSYAMGSDVGRYFNNLGDDIDFESLIRGITDGFTDAELAMSPEEVIMVQKEFGARLQAKQMAELEEMKQKNLEAGKAYLEENKKKDGVMVTESGLQYEFITKGDGPMPKLNDEVKVDYVGSLIDGTEFDSSVAHGQPIVFAVNQVIPGWKEAMQLIPVGSKVRLVIPSELAYGEQGVMPRIEPNSVLVFEVELLSIEEPQEAPAEGEMPVPEQLPAS